QDERRSRGCGPRWQVNIDQMVLAVAVPQDEVRLGGAAGGSGTRLRTGAVGGGCCLVWGGVHGTTLRNRVGAMTKWEYTTAPVLVDTTKQILDNFGQDGWVLVQIVPGMDAGELVEYIQRTVAGARDGAHQSH